MSTQLTPQNQPKEKIPRRVKKEVKKRQSSESPTSLARKSRRPFRPRLASEVLTEVQTEPPKPPRTPKDKTLACVARKIESMDSVMYKRLRDRRRNLDRLALEFVEGPFAFVLAKHKGYDRLELMKEVIGYIRDQPKPKQELAAPTEEVAKPKRKRIPTRRQRQQAAATLRPVVNIASARTPPRGAPKSVPSRKTYGDSVIVLDAVRALFQGNTELQEVFCRASPSGLRRLLYTNKPLQKLAKRVCGELRSPARLSNYLRDAVSAVVDEERNRRQEQEQIAREQADARRKQQRDEAIEAARLRQQKLRRKRWQTGIARRAG